MVDLEELLGCGGNPAMIFQCQANSFGGSIFNRFGDPLHTAFEGNFFGVSFSNFPGKDTNDGCPQQNGVVDPLLRHRHLGLESRAFGKTEVVPNGCARNIKTFTEGLVFAGVEVLWGYIFREVVACQFAAIEAERCAIVDERRDRRSLGVSFHPSL